MKIIKFDIVLSNSRQLSQTLTNSRQLSPTLANSHQLLYTSILATMVAMDITSVLNTTEVADDVIVFDFSQKLPENSSVHLGIMISINSFP